MREGHGSGADLDSGLWLPGEAARFLKISTRTLFALESKGKVRSVRFGRSVRYHPADVRDFVSQHRRHEPREPVAVHNCGSVASNKG